ncbi:MAG: hypothetical protein PUF73_01010, partial [Gemmiger formicilis]|nr:hypothetical protein [Gemmiger formicilis]
FCKRNGFFENVRCSKVYKNRGSRRRKKHGTGQGSKAAVQKPERRLPDRLGQAGTDIPTGSLYVG